MPGTKDEAAVETPETTTEPIVAKTVEGVKGKFEELPEEEKSTEEKEKSEEAKEETTNEASSDAAESNTESESAAEKPPAEDKDEETEDGTPKKKAKTDSTETESSNGTDETQGATESVSAARPLRYTLPTFRETPNNITAVVGSDVILPCSVDNLGPKSVIWKKVNKASPITIGEYVYDPDNRYSVTREDPYMDSQMASIDSQRIGYENPRWNLQITNVDFQHAGTYECQISTKEDFARNVTLNIIKDRNRESGKKTGIKLSGTQFVEKGTTIDLNCTATDIDYRPKGVDWFKDGTRVKAGGRTLVTEYLVSETNVLHSRLEIERVGMEDAGTYVCRFSQHHVESMKVIVLNTDSFNKRRGTGTDGLESAVADNQKAPNSTARAERVNCLSIVVTLTFIYALLT